MAYQPIENHGVHQKHAHGCARGEQARRVVDAVEARLWSPLGLRSLARDDRWLIGPFADAWVRVRGGTPEAREEARRRFLEPLMAHLAEAGTGHVSEIADADRRTGLADARSRPGRWERSCA